MRILHIVNDYFPNSKAGTEHYISELTAEQMNLGYLPSILYAKVLEESSVNQENFYKIIDSEHQNIPTYILNIPTAHINILYNSHLSTKLKPWLFNMKFNLVHIHSLINFSYSLLDAIEKHTPVVFTFHDFWLLCSNAILIHSAGQVCNGPDTLDKCTDCQNINCNNISSNFLIQRNAYSNAVMKRINLGVCPSKFSLYKYKKFGSKDANFIHEHLGMRPVKVKSPSPYDKSSIRFSYLGGICWFKGLDTAVSAFRVLKLNNIHLNIHGRISSKEYFEKIMEIVNGDSRIKYFGEYDKQDLGPIFESCDCLILPSRIESYSFVVREAFSAGIPVIASNAGALPEIVKHGKNGLLFKTGDGADLALQISKIAKNPRMLLDFQERIKPVKTIKDDALRLSKYYESIAKS